MTNWLIHHMVKNSKETEDPAVRAAYGRLGSLTGIVVNCLLSVTKIVAGVISGSLAIVADGVNNLGDASGAIVSLITTHMAAKPVDEEHPFGHGRMEYIGSLVIGGIIILAGYHLLEDGIKGVLHPAELKGSTIIVAILSLSIILKGWLYHFYKTLARIIHSEPLAAEAKDSISDIFGTVAIFISIVLQMLKGWSIDSWMSIIVALLVLKTGIEVCHDTIDILLGKEPDKELVRQLEEKLLSYPEIHGVHDLIVHDYGPGRVIVTVHAEVSVDSNIVAIHEVIDKAEREIGKSMHLMICIHMDPTVTNDPTTTRVKEQMQEFLKSVDNRLSLHDFRMVPGKNAINLVFDCLLPPNGYKDVKGLEKQIADYATSLDKRYHTVVQFDTDFV